MKNQRSYIELLEKYAIIVLAYLYKAMRYIFRLLYKIMRLIYRLIKKGGVYLFQKIKPHYHKALEKIYIRACNTFDLK